MTNSSKFSKKLSMTTLNHSQSNMSFKESQFAKKRKEKDDSQFDWLSEVSEATSDFSKSLNLEKVFIPLMLYSSSSS